MSLRSVRVWFAVLAEWRKYRSATPVSPQPGTTPS
jgi:hypothetical protein